MKKKKDNKEERSQRVLGKESLDSFRLKALGPPTWHVKPQVLLKKLREGFDIALTPDGPKGPRHSVADGIVAMAKKSNVKIVTFNYRADRYWQLGSWDRFIIPKPFSTIEFFASEPFSINHLSDEEAKIYIRERLLENAIK